MTAATETDSGPRRGQPSWTAGGDEFDRARQTPAVARVWQAIAVVREYRTAPALALRLGVLPGALWVTEPVS